MSFLDKLKAVFSGDPGTHDHEHPHEHDHDHDHNHDHSGAYLQTPTQPDHVAQPTLEEIAAAAQAEPPTTTVAGLGDGVEQEVSR